MLVVTSENFEQEVLNAQGPVLVDFFADWCMPCKMFAPILEDAQEQLGSRVKIVKINIDESIQLAQKYRVMSIPTLKLFTGEEEPRATFVGAMSQEELVDIARPSMLHVRTLAQWSLKNLHRADRWQQQKLWKTIQDSLTVSMDLNSVCR